MTTTPDKGSRPLSPHLQIYRPQITTVLSILHRITSVGLALGAVLMTWWLLSLVYSINGTYQTFHGFAGSIVGRVMLFCWMWAYLYHLLNGVRHLVWDAGYGINIPSATKSGWAVVGTSVVLTFLIWGLI